jgi:hypothetical protein
VQEVPGSNPGGPTNKNLPAIYSFLNRSSVPVRASSWLVRNTFELMRRFFLYHIYIPARSRT